MATILTEGSTAPTGSNPATARRTRYIGSIIVEVSPVDSSMSTSDIAKNTLRLRVDITPGSEGKGSTRLIREDARASESGEDRMAPATAPAVFSTRDQSLDQSVIQKINLVIAHDIGSHLIQAKKAGLNCKHRLTFKVPPTAEGEEEMVIMDMGEDAFLQAQEIYLPDDEKTKKKKKKKKKKARKNAKDGEEDKVDREDDDGAGVPEGYSRAYLIGSENTVKHQVAIAEGTVSAVKAAAARSAHDLPEPSTSSSAAEPSGSHNPLGQTAAQPSARKQGRVEEQKEYVMLTKMRTIHSAKGPKELVITIRDALYGLLNNLFIGWMHRNIMDETVAINRNPEEGVMFGGFADLDKKDVTVDGFRKTIAVIHNFKSSAKWVEYTRGIRDNRHLIPSPFSAKHIFSEEDRYYRRDSREQEPLYCPMFDIESLMWVMVWVMAHKVIQRTTNKKSIYGVKEHIIEGMHAEEWKRNPMLWGPTYSASVAWHKMVLISTFGRRCVPMKEFLGPEVRGDDLSDELNEVQLEELCNSVASFSASYDSASKSGADEKKVDPEELKASLMGKVREQFAEKERRSKCNAANAASNENDTPESSGKGKAKQGDAAKANEESSAEEQAWAGDIAEDIPDFAPFRELLRGIFVRLDKFNTTYVCENTRPSMDDFVGMYRDFIALFDAHIPEEETWEYIK